MLREVGLVVDVGVSLGAGDGGEGVGPLPGGREVRKVKLALLAE